MCMLERKGHFPLIDHTKEHISQKRAYSTFTVLLNKCAFQRFSAGSYQIHTETSFKPILQWVQAVQNFQAEHSRNIPKVNILFCLLNKLQLCAS
jgi:hypothetical protein